MSNLTAKETLSRSPSFLFFQISHRSEREDTRREQPGKCKMEFSDHICFDVEFLFSLSLSLVKRTRTDKVRLALKKKKKKTRETETLLR